MKISFYLFTGFLLMCSSLSAQFDPRNSINNKRSDTIDVLDYKMNLDFTDMSNKKIIASCRVLFESKMDNVDGVSLDLLAFDIDSVKQGLDFADYSYNDTLLRITLNSPLLANDIDSVTVFYSGTPQTDPSGFGGFYFENNYAYNLGVGFEAKPHNYGRTWHPCFDNFVERATYDITLVTPELITGYSNGYIESEFVNDNGENVRRWIMEENIPSYLACVGVADYTHVNQEYTSSLNDEKIPVMLISRSVDTSNFKNSFMNLFDAMKAFEINYGPYVWNKIAFALVPFNSGAMEHSSCVMYPRVAANGTLQFETLMAHELAHHWWGNLVTCRTSEDMWINEGLASYSEAIFLENTYGYESYISELKGVHRDVIQSAHIRDGAFYPLSGVPHEVTYGSHSYSKGSTMMHNLRTHLGDDDFFKGLHDIQTNYAFKDIDVFDFKDELETSTGKNLGSFFNNYVLNPGFNGFEIDSFNVKSNGDKFNVNVFIQQKVFEAPDLFSDVPMEITFMDIDKNEISLDMNLSGELSDFTFEIPFNPEMVYLNKNYKLLNAVTGENIWVAEPRGDQMNYSYFTLTTEEATDSNLVRIEHYRVAPDESNSPFIDHQFTISTDRFWKIDGIWSDDFKARGRVFFDARDNNVGNLDLSLMTDHEGVAYHEDSIVLLYRPNQAFRWEEFDEYILSTLGSPTDGYSRIDFSNIKKGEYTFGFRKNLANVSTLKKNNFDFSVYPNPTDNEVTIDFNELKGEKQVAIINLEGRIVKEIETTQESVIINTQNLKSGNYNLILMKNNQVLGVKKLIKLN